MLSYQGSALLKTHTLRPTPRLGKPRDQLFSNHEAGKRVVLAFSTENIYLQEMKSITYLATYMFRLQKQVVCSFIESSRRFKKEKQGFLFTRWPCLQCQQPRWDHIEMTCIKMGRPLNTLAPSKTDLWQKNRDICSQKRLQCSLPRSLGGVGWGCFCTSITVLFLLNSFECLHKPMLYPHERRERERSAEMPWGCHTQSDSESHGIVLHGPRQWLWPWICLSLQAGNTR